MKLRNEILSLSVDEYVLSYADPQIDYFGTLSKVAQACRKKTVLRYEDLILDFDKFVKDFRCVADVSDEVVRSLYEKSRPNSDVDGSSHRRSGATRRFAKDKKLDTIVQWDEVLAPILEKFDYSG